MSVPPTNSISSVTASSPSSVSYTQTQTGLSSIGSSISSAGGESTGFFSDLISFVTRPFIAIGSFFASTASNVNHFFGSFFASKEGDPERITFIQSNMKSLSGAVYEEALDKFSHISNVKDRVVVFRIIQNSADVSALTTRAFYDHLPVDTQNHLERHIWIENGRDDMGQGLQFGKNVINADIKAEIVGKALDKCLSE